ncbi:hypothetical protein JCM17846_16390 [Iodidimonas nitroreducens]|uniref:DUF302 domain-containing protein n=1 Tax=Iodidimonas nitroreducens TaxID=1236968 RepID=A0A5A7N7K6_9PROT|nr:DUF302 domain-containing protein [Iodidimonas nitroreducens]GAK33714.1 putative fluoride ion transporter CrcB 1 [alpha proteobacterium Q-1]GER03957.1 hypothetical protein JCM17846_16390 [Iodidimonas nitroreducens]
MRPVFILIAFIVFLLGSCTSEGKDHHHEQANGLLILEGGETVAQTMDRLEQAATARGFKVFARIDHQAGAESIDQALRPTQLLIFGNPAGGTPLMQAAQSFGIDLPLKALVYEDETGAIKIAFNDPRFLAQRHGLPNPERMIQKMTGLLEALAQAAQ